MLWECSWAALRLSLCDAAWLRTGLLSWLWFSLLLQGWSRIVLGVHVVPLGIVVLLEVVPGIGEGTAVCSCHILCPSMALGIHFLGFLLIVTSVRRRRFLLKILPGNLKSLHFSSL